MGGNVVIATPTQQDVPGAPTAVSATAGTGRATVSWTIPAADGGAAIAGYDVQYSSDDGTMWTSASSTFHDKAATTETVTGLTNGTAYVFRVAAINSVGTGDYSQPSTAVTPIATTTTPAAPTGVTASAGNGQATVSWTAPSDDGGSAVSGYDVEYSSDNGSTWTSASSAFHTSASTTESVSGLTNGTAYLFRVAAINSVGTGDYSQPSTAVTPTAPNVAPGAPTAVRATAGNGRAIVSWTAPADDGGAPIAGYDVEYSTDNGATWTSASSTFHSNTATSETVTGLTNGTSYIFRVAAINSTGTGNYSAASAAVTPAADGSKLVAGASHAAITDGGTLHLHATLTDVTTSSPGSGATVELLSRAAAHKPWRELTAATTGPAGVAGVTVTPTANTQYSWYYAGDASHASATSNTESVTVAQRVTARNTRHRLAHGHRVSIYGTVAPGRAGKTVVLEQKIDGHWKKTHFTAGVHIQRLPRGGRELGYVISLKERRKSHLTYRIYSAATGSNAAGESNAMHLRVT